MNTLVSSSAGNNAPDNKPSNNTPGNMQAAVSDGLWALAWKRFKRDRIGMGSMVVVAAFLLLCIASALGLVGSEWWMEKGVNYARPSFSPGLVKPTTVEPSKSPSGTTAPASGSAAPSSTGSAPNNSASNSAASNPAASNPAASNPAASNPAASNPAASNPASQNPDDPLADVLNQIRSGTPPSSAKPDTTGSAGSPAKVEAATKASNSDDPLAGILGEIRSGSPTASAPSTSSTASPNSPSAPVGNAKGSDSPKVQAMDGPKAQLLPFGGDKWGRDVLSKAIKGAQTSLLVGFAAALVATAIGTILGAFAGYYGGRTDDFLNWFYSIFSAIPYILLVLAIAAVLQSKGVMTVVLVLGLTGWTTVFRLVRAEYLKHKSRDYVRAADAIGASDSRRMFVHILPNVSHVILVNLSLLVVGFIKSEVILSYLGFGVPVDTVSWGSMLNESQNELILGYWWQLLAATLFMGVLVTAFSLFTDSLRDALDPKLK
jgi:peptide/nickel transport system permease protein